MLNPAMGYRCSVGGDREIIMIFIKSTPHLSLAEVRTTILGERYHTSPNNAILCFIFYQIDINRLLCSIYTVLYDDEKKYVT